MPMEAPNIAKAVFDALGAKTYVINAQPDGTNITNAGSNGISGTAEICGENGMDVGFAYDGDAVRPLSLRRREGNVITGDHISPHLRKIYERARQAAD